MQDLWEAYKENLKIEAEEWLKVQYVGKEGVRKTDRMKLPLVLEGFYTFCYKRKGNVQQYFDNAGGYYPDFIVVCARIRTEIRADQITGGLLGVFHPSITQRLNGLVEKTDVRHEGQQTVKVSWK